ncbi:GGDEF domain-containing protein [Psychromonas sp. Urea-02u-13]|uniref:GGDEF domain-containing protein n=1 Tax=Psychromonas sp. Urea-02u-13 TaxID=2058326 RepID=UPI000C32F322|nr:GGDEF domain-containing protein [Psychromonas sp. Urea-02u-13]PKG40330.1 hypothetical protein CXF74_03155 [Psychromonas sp. Urea-02u-13]
MPSIKQIAQHTLLWLSLLLFAKTQIYFEYIGEPAEFFGEIFMLAACCSLLLETHRLKLGWLMTIGWFLYGCSLIADVLDEYYVPKNVSDVLDLADDLLKIGVVFIGFSFYNALKEKKVLINNLQLEIEYRRDLEAKLHEVTRLDELTQIGNRRAFFQCYTKLITEYKRPLLIFIDLDNFKQLNDTQGHQQGDELLKKFATCLSKHCVGKGEAYRFGGDEFVILYDAQEGESLISTIKHDMYDLFEATKVSISYGCLEINDQQDADTQILKVDELMYKNKLHRKSLRKITRPELI